MRARCRRYWRVSKCGTQDFPGSRPPPALNEEIYCEFLGRVFGSLKTQSSDASQLVFIYCYCLCRQTRLFIFARLGLTAVLYNTYRRVSWHFHKIPHRAQAYSSIIRRGQRAAQRTESRILYILAFNQTQHNISKLTFLSAKRRRESGSCEPKTRHGQRGIILETSLHFFAIRLTFFFRPFVYAQSSRFERWSYTRVH